MLKYTRYSYGIVIHYFWVDRLSTPYLFLLHDVYYTEGVCGFRLNTDAGFVYHLVDVDNGVIVPAQEGRMYKATLKIRQHFGSGTPVVINVSAECGSLALFKNSLFEIPHDLARGGLLCRCSTDCLKDGEVCVIGKD